MIIRFRKKELNIPWEYFAAPFLVVLAFIIVLSFRAGTGSEELIAVSDSATSGAPTESVSPAAPGGTQVPFDEPDPDDNPSDAAGTATQPGSDGGKSVTQKVNINKAGMDELISLPYIGEVKAKAIIEYRNANGPFKSADDLLNVKGIGPKTLEKLLPLITLE